MKYKMLDKDMSEFYSFIWMIWCVLEGRIKVIEVKVYFLVWIDNDDFVDTCKQNIYNFLVYHENYSWNNTQEKIDDYSWYDKKTKTINTHEIKDFIKNNNKAFIDKSLIYVEDFFKLREKK